MARDPVKKQRLIVATPIRRDQFSNVEPVKPTPNGKAPDPRLAEVVAALRREMEAVALIAASDERDVPRFHLSEVEMDFAYAVSAVEDEGVRVVLDRDKLTDVPDNKLHRLRLKIVDADVQALMGAVKTREG